MNIQYFKPRQDRSNPYMNRGKMPDNQEHTIGALNETKGDPGKPCSSKTLAMLISKGLLSQVQITQAFKMGRIKPAEFKKAFWASINLAKPTPANLTMMNDYHAILF